MFHMTVLVCFRVVFIIVLFFICPPKSSSQNDICPFVFPYFGGRRSTALSTFNFFFLLCFPFVLLFYLIFRIFTWLVSFGIRLHLISLSNWERYCLCQRSTFQLRWLVEISLLGLMEAVSPKPIFPEAQVVDADLPQCHLMRMTVQKPW